MSTFVNTQTMSTLSEASTMFIKLTLNMTVKKAYYGEAMFNKGPFLSIHCINYDEI